MNTPNTGIPYVPEGTLDPAAGLNLALNVIDALLQCAVINMTTTAPPTATDGDLYIVASPATGEWAGHETDLARYVSEGDFWQFFASGTQVHLVLNLDDGALYAFDGSSSPGTWSTIGGGGGSLTVQDSDSPPSEVVNGTDTIIAGGGLILTEVSPGVALLETSGAAEVLFQLALSDLTTDLTSGAGKAYFRAPYAFTLTDVRASLATASASGGPVTVDINNGGSTVLSTKLTIDDTEKTSVTATAAAVISSPDFADDDEVSFDIDDEGTGAKGLIVTLYGVRV